MSFVSAARRVPGHDAAKRFRAVLEPDLVVVVEHVGANASGPPQARVYFEPGRPAHDAPAASHEADVAAFVVVRRKPRHAGAAGPDYAGPRTAR